MEARVGVSVGHNTFKHHRKRRVRRWLCHFVKADRGGNHKRWKRACEVVRRSDHSRDEHVLGRQRITNDRDHSISNCKLILGDSDADLNAGATRTATGSTALTLVVDSAADVTSVSHSSTHASSTAV